MSDEVVSYIEPIDHNLSWCDRSTHAEIDRCARAYGWEIGAGKRLGRIITLSPNNPFKDPNWREKMSEDFEFSPTAIPEDGMVVWNKNGDHPGDKVGEYVDDGMGGAYQRVEGAVVRFFRHPDPAYAGDKIHPLCNRTWHDHGWIDVGSDGITVCPGEMIPIDIESALSRSD